MIAISDSSLLITLSRAHQIELLREFFSQVAIPREVYEEVTVAGAGLPGAEEVRRASWIRVYSVPLEPLETVKAASAGLAVAGSIAIFERGARLNKITDLRSVYLDLIEQGIRFDRRLLEQSLRTLGLGKLKP